MKTPPDLCHPLPERLREEARVWLRRLTSEQATEWDAQAFRRWRQTSPDHARAFEEAKRQWQALGPAIGLLLQQDEAAARRHERAMRTASPGRRMFLRAGGGAMAVAVGAAIVHPPFQLWPSAEEWQADARTAKGERRELVLGEGVQVILNTQTSIRREMADAGGAAIDLINGEAAVELSGRDATFSVQAGAGRSMARAGQFEVRHLDGRVCVTCLRGSVEIAHPKGNIVLAARQQVRYDNDSLGAPSMLEGASVSAWRRGELVFRQIPLAEVIAEINRYRPGRVVLAAISLATHPVNGRFAIAALDNALLQLQYSFDLKSRRLPGGILILS